MPQFDDHELTMVNTLSIRARDVDDFVLELQEILPLARRLDACLLLEAGQVIDDPTTFILSERWRSGWEYVNTVLALPIYQKYLSATEAMYDEPRVVAALRGL